MLSCVEHSGPGRPIKPRSLVGCLAVGEGPNAIGPGDVGAEVGPIHRRHPSFLFTAGCRRLP